MSFLLIIFSNYALKLNIQKNALKLIARMSIINAIFLHMGCLHKTSHNSTVILSDFFKHSNITQFYMYILLIIFLNYALMLNIQKNALKLM